MCPGITTGPSITRISGSSCCAEWPGLLRKTLADSIPLCYAARPSGNSRSASRSRLTKKWPRDGCGKGMGGKGMSGQGNEGQGNECDGVGPVTRSVWGPKPFHLALALALVLVLVLPLLLVLLLVLVLVLVLPLVLLRVVRRPIATPAPQLILPCSYVRWPGGG